MIVKPWIMSILIACCGSTVPQEFNDYLSQNILISNQVTEKSTLRSQILVEHGANMIISNEIESNFHKLKEKEIRSKIIGKTISPDLSISQSSLDFSEKFFLDGRWTSVRKMRGPVQFEGEWFIDNDRICVRPRDGHIACRYVWKSLSSGIFYISDLSGSPHSNKIIRINVD